MTNSDLHTLATEAGLETRWRDVHGQYHDVSPDTQRAVLAALGLPAATAAQIADSRTQVAALAHPANRVLITARQGQPIDLPGAPGPYSIRMEDGSLLEGHAEAGPAGARLPAIDVPGYHVLQFAGSSTTVAVAPLQGWRIRDAAQGRKLWGLAVQLYSLRRPGDGGLGDFGALAELVRGAGARGAGAVAVSPVHAQFSADPDRFSPYAPSSRVAMNVLHADVPDGAIDQADRAALAALEHTELVDWPAAARLRLRLFRAAFDRQRDALRADAAFAAFRQANHDVRLHAVFEALHATQFSADAARWHWKDWPAELRDPASPAVANFAKAHATEVDFHAWLQFLADQGLGAAQQAARDAGMPIGLIADLAVGTDGGGSHAWGRQTEMLTGMSVGAPPDLLNTRGQDWGVTAFSPRGLMASGFSAFTEMLRAALRHAGGVRIDHVMGLARLWVVPAGAGAAEGAYLRFPMQDMMRLVALESWRHKAVVLGEDLGTLPDGFRQHLDEAGVAGLRVMWFEREGEFFTDPRGWSRDAVAMTTTHDLPTVAGWWQERELDWWQRLGYDQANARAERAEDRERLWNAFRFSSASATAQPTDDDGTAAANAACAHIGTATCDLALLPLEDALALPEQPNLPGTIDQHPNWRRRMPGATATLLDDPATAARLDALSKARG